MIPFPILAAMLRLGKKYEIDYLRDEALTRLTSEFPRTLKEMQLLPPEYSYIKHQKGILYDIINLARETAVYSILPVAFYLCLQDIVGHQSSSGMTVLTLLSSGKDFFWRRTGRW